MSSDRGPGGAGSEEAGTGDGGITRTFGWEDMFVPPEEDPRGQGGLAGERAVLTSYLRDYRLTLELKCSGLDAAALARRSVPPSNLSLLGLVRHLTDVERHWFRRVIAGQDAPWRYPRDEDEDAAINQAVADPEAVAAAWAAWREEGRFADSLVAGAPGLNMTVPYGEGTISLREVLVHMIEEYARHAGHADLLRERIDGRVGQ
jgi:uncharacterized damage-inducible protein DinB